MAVSDKVHSATKRALNGWNSVRPGVNYSCKIRVKGTNRRAIGVGQQRLPGIEPQLSNPEPPELLYVEILFGFSVPAPPSTESLLTGLRDHIILIILRELNSRPHAQVPRFIRNDHGQQNASDEKSARHVYAPARTSRYKL